MAAPQRIWTVEKEDKLAELWQEQRVLYDISSSIYHDRVVRDDILQRVAQELHLSVNDVQTRMAMLRTQFGKLIKEKASGSGYKQPTARQKWILQHLQFLKPFVMQRSNQSSLETTPCVQGGACSDMENDTDPSLSLEQSSCDTPCEEKLPASGKPSRSVKYKFQKNDNIEQQKIAILNKVADRIANKEEKGEYSFGKQIGEELIIL
ncbi:Pheromone-processing carboxypeptidase KEX1 [Labeo rohita]|uniref:Pheromone-processing carboxypeptidase KEX1 n=1 Tax=Labeo rohita TaxID=84645 RepID=A0ABQ8LE11_LABRO|nr:Pheromone-processing carboxypeptidase KEX1 [Labeo rohita]